MVVRVKSTRFDWPGPFRRIIQREFGLEELKERPDENFFPEEHRIPLQRLLARYHSSLKNGLDAKTVIRNRIKYGCNVFETNEAKSGFQYKTVSVEVKKIVKSFFFGLNALLWVCAILSLVTSGIYGLFFNGQSYDAELVFGATLILVTIISGLSFYYQEYKSSRIMESFSRMMNPHMAMVKRDGHFKEILAEELCVGDIVKLTYGDVIPADIRLIETQEFYVDNSSLTGESDPKKRDPSGIENDPMETKNLVFYSTHAVEGHAKGVVIAVGPNTVMGKMVELAGKVEAKKSTSPVVREIEDFIKNVSILSLFMGLIFSGFTLMFRFSWQDAVQFFTEIIVASVPEGLNLTCTILLVMMAKKMAAKGCLVKNLHALETLASAAVLVTDKTGTLTQNRMSVAHLWFNAKFAEADTSEFVGNEDVDVLGTKKLDRTDPCYKALARAARLCSRAKFKPMQGDVPLFRKEVNGDASEAAILRFMEVQFRNVKKYRGKFKVLVEIPFNSRNKYQVFVHDLGGKEAGSGHLLTIKGAPEEVLKLCNRILIGGREIELTPQWRDRVEESIQALGSLGERVIGFGDTILPPEKYNEGYEYSVEKPEFLLTGLRFLGLISMIDPPRAAVPEAIKKIRQTGTKVVMLTGDHPTTALAIARAVNLISEGNETIQEINRRHLNKFLKSQGQSTAHHKHNHPHSVVHMSSIQDEDEEDEISPYPSSSPNPNLPCTCSRLCQANAIVVTGSEIKRMSSVELKGILTSGKELIFARTTPEQKYLLVEALQGLGQFVAVTGDGVNDSPALKKADVGISMGITGTEVSKAISDIVLLNDDFASIPLGIQEGRAGFENLKKILAYSLADNVAEMWSFVACVVLGVPLPLGTMAILLTVLGTDLFPALSLRYESKEKEVDKEEAGRRAGQKLITGGLLQQAYLRVAVVEAVAGYFAYFWVMGCFGFLPGRLFGIRKQWEKEGVQDLRDSWGQEWTYHARMHLQMYAQTAFFVAVVIMQVANVIICKTRRESILRKGMRNWIMNIAIVLAIAMAWGIIYVPFLANFFGMAPLKPIHWSLAIPFAVYLILCDEMRRLYLRSSKPLSNYGMYRVMLSY